MRAWTIRWTTGLLGALFALNLLACSGGGGGGGGTTTFSLAVTGNPTGARVFLNGQLVENPQRIVLPPGTHRIRVETTLSNGQVVAQEFTIVAGSIGSIQYDLSRYQIETNPAVDRGVGGRADSGRSDPARFADQRASCTRTSSSRCAMRTWRAQRNMIRTLCASRGCGAARPDWSSPTRARASLSKCPSRCWTFPRRRIKIRALDSPLHMWYNSPCEAEGCLSGRKGPPAKRL
jgi:hypothetical protein